MSSIVCLLSFRFDLAESIEFVFAAICVCSSTESVLNSSYSCYILLPVLCVGVLEMGVKFLFFFNFYRLVCFINRKCTSGGFVLDCELFRLSWSLGHDLN